jgi:hypothetical protein
MSPREERCTPLLARRWQPSLQAIVALKPANEGLAGSPPLRGLRWYAHFFVINVKWFTEWGPRGGYDCSCFEGNLDHVFFGRGTDQ